jgi:CBS domain containing-hemolysin-like protein
MAEPNSFMDTAADIMAVVVIIIAPIIAISVFWLVHIIPEKVAEKRHHPQKEAIKILCLLSLVFGGMLWPFAWIWAYSKPVIHKLAYGKDTHEDADAEQPRVLEAEESDTAALRAEVESLRLQVQALVERGAPPTEVKPGTQRADAEQRVLEKRPLSEARH